MAPMHGTVVTGYLAAEDVSGIKPDLGKTHFLIVTSPVKEVCRQQLFYSLYSEIKAQRDIAGSSFPFGQIRSTTVAICCHPEGDTHLRISPIFHHLSASEPIFKAEYTNR